MSKEEIKKVVNDFVAGKMTDAKAGLADIIQGKVVDTTADATGIDKSELVPSQDTDDNKDE